MVPRARPAGLGWVPVQQRAEDLTTAERTCLMSKSHICHYYTTIREYNIIIILYYIIVGIIDIQVRVTFD